MAPENTQKLKEARTIIEQGGAYVSDTESEDEKEPELCRPAGAPLYQENGHHWRCCEMRCVCPNSTGIGSNTHSKLWVPYILAWLTPWASIECAELLQSVQTGHRLSSKPTLPGTPD